MAINEALRDELLKLEGPVFAVLDGAQFDDLPRALIDGDFVYRPLYRDRGGQARDFDLTAPQLVWLDRSFESSEDASAQPKAGRNAVNTGAIDPSILERLLEIIEEKPAAVFWQCSEGGERLFRHLRGINMILYPSGETMSDTERVLFRHSDGNVLYQVLPCFDPMNFDRTLGPASQVLFVVDRSISDRGWMRAEREETWFARGPLALSRDTLDCIEMRRTSFSNRRIANYLRRTAPDGSNESDNVRMERWVENERKDAATLGINSESSLGRWCYMQRLTGGSFGRNPGVREYVGKGKKSGTSGERMKLMMQSVAKAAESTES